MDFFSTKIAYASVDSFVRKVNISIINPIIWVLFAVAVLVFLYGVLQFLIGQASEEKKTVGKSHMIWGIVGIFIMLSVWTILGFLTRALGIDYVNPGATEVNKTVDPLPKATEIKFPN